MACVDDWCEWRCWITLHIHARTSTHVWNRKMRISATQFHVVIKASFVYRCFLTFGVHLFENFPLMIEFYAHVIDCSPTKRYNRTMAPKMTQAEHSSRLTCTLLIIKWIWIFPYTNLFSPNPSRRSQILWQHLSISFCRSWRIRPMKWLYNWTLQNTRINFIVTLTIEFASISERWSKSVQIINFIFQLFCFSIEAPRTHHYCFFMLKLSLRAQSFFFSALETSNNRINDESIGWKTSKNSMCFFSK